jgi:hypothetical protein
MSTEKVSRRNVPLALAYGLSVVAIAVALASHFRMLPQWTLMPIRTQMLALEDETGDSRMMLTTLGGGSFSLSATDDNGDIVIAGGAGPAGRGQMTFGSTAQGGSIHIDGGSTEMAPFIEMRDGGVVRLRVTLDDDGNPILVNPVTGETKRVFDDPVEGG